MTASERVTRNVFLILFLAIISLCVCYAVWRLRRKQRRRTYLQKEIVVEADSPLPIFLSGDNRRNSIKISEWDIENLKDEEEEEERKEESKETLNDDEIVSSWQVKSSADTGTLDYSTSAPQAPQRKQSAVSERIVSLQLSMAEPIPPKRVQSTHFDYGISIPEVQAFEQVKAPPQPPVRKQSALYARIELDAID